ncbi:MAG: ABC transporter ATP-binding protein [Rhodospirillaceae bacterium]|nr:ABC transporter ATP-binding protein [Rhodospirillaceae bacterium]
MSAVRTEGLGRVYVTAERTTQALSDVTLSFAEGEVSGLLGPNGAGKTTLVKILSTVLLPTAGRAFVLGHDVVGETAKVRPLIGIVFGGDRGLHWQLTARETLEYWAALYDVPVREVSRRSVSLLERVGLAAWADTRIENYSRGMKQRLHLARGLISDARVLFLDEPTIGMDPLAARDFRGLVKELKAEGRTILLTTHDMAEAEAVCDRVALIDHGRVLAIETPASLAQMVSAYERIDYDHGDPGLAVALRQLPGIAAVTLQDGGAHRITMTDGAAIQSILQFLVGAGVTSLRTSRPSLEEVYVHIIGDRGLKV